MRARCEEAQAQLQSTDEACKTLLDRAGSLRDERYASSLPPTSIFSGSCTKPHRQEIKTRQSIVDLFLARFTLSDDEANALSSSNVPVGPTFFAAMDRAQKIRDDCRVLMAGEDSPSKAGCVFTPPSSPTSHRNRLDIMAVTAAHLERAYDKLIRWCSSEFRGMGRDASLEVSDELSEAVRRLRSRPELLACVTTPLPLPSHIVVTRTSAKRSRRSRKHAKPPRCHPS